MHPNVYLRTFWRSEVRPEIFVAMSFAGPYEKRYQDIIRPAIEAIKRGSVALRAVRVDLSKSGDSILSDIMDGIAHSEMVLADVSTVGHDSKTGVPYRNGNVMYEVGLALACRQPSEVLLIRDDKDKFLFDVSTIPHKHLDFGDAEKAKNELSEELILRLRERDHIYDARIQIALATLTAQEHGILKAFAPFAMGQVFHLNKGNLGTLAAIPRLLDKQLLVTAGMTVDNQAAFQWTRLGYALACSLETLIPKVGQTELTKPQPESPTAQEEAPGGGPGE
jgi:hypothetical protein